MEEEIDFKKYLPSDIKVFDNNNIVKAFHVNEQRKFAFFRDNGELIIDNCTYVLKTDNYYFLDHKIYDKNFDFVVDLSNQPYVDLRFIDIFDNGIIFEDVKKKIYQVLSLDTMEFINEFTLPTLDRPTRTPKAVNNNMMNRDGMLYDFNGILISDNIYKTYKNYFLKIINQKQLQFNTYDGKVLIDAADSVFISKNENYYGYSLENYAYIFNRDGKKLFEIDKGFKVANILSDTLYVFIKDETYLIVKDGKPIIKMHTGEYCGFLENSDCIFKKGEKLYNVNNTLVLNVPDTYKAEFDGKNIHVYNDKRVLIFDTNFTQISEHKLEDYLFHITVLRSRKEKFELLSTLV